MDASTLERLLIDRSLGALSADVEALLAGHLERSPADAAAAAAFERTVDLVGRALAAPAASTHEPLPPMSFRDIERRERLGLWRRRMLNGGGMAAALLFGCILGASVFGRGGVATGPAGTEARSTGLDGAAPGVIVQLPRGSRGSRGSRGDAGDAGAAGAAGAAGIWSAERLLRQARPPVDGGNIRLIWDSPIRAPRFGEPT